MANSCASRALVLLARGNLRSLVVIVTVGVTAQMTLKGLIAPARAAVLQWSQATPPVNSLPALVAASGLDGLHARVLAAVASSVPRWRCSPWRMGRSGRSGGQVAAAIWIGLLIPAGWFATGYLGADEFEPSPVTSLSFVAPVADAVQYVMVSTGMAMNFGIAVVSGVLLGSFVTALLTHRFAWEGFSSPRHMLRSLGGATLMGCGGAMAYGCTIGQGLTGLSTLALPSFAAGAGILIGAAAALRGPARVQALATA